MHAICEELRRIMKKHGSWELVDFQSADGEKIRITLVNRTYVEEGTQTRCNFHSVLGMK